MPFGDVPPPPEKAAQAQVEKVRDGDRAETNPLQSEALNLLAAQSSGDGKQVQNVGRVSSMNLPDGWTEAAEKPSMTGIGTRSLREFHPADDPNAKLTVFYRGLPVHDGAASSLQNVLNQPEHKLSGDELSGLKDILRERLDPNIVTLNSAKTETIDNRKVLTIEGHYKETGTNIKEIVVGADGGAVQEIYFQAPEATFNKYAAQADQALKSIKWK